MTCEEVRRHCEDDGGDTKVWSGRGAVAEHVANCADCSRYVEEQRALRLNLRKVRESVPEVPETLDAAVAAGYRRYFAERIAASAEQGRWLRPAAAWVWSAVAAGVLAMVAFWFFSASHQTGNSHASISNRVDGLPVTHTAAATPAVPATVAAKQRPTTASKTYRSRSTRQRAEMPVREARSLPEGFRSLMYCDALSCPGEMDMIRVQLPASAMYRQVPGFVQTSGSVTADVLVGPDGIARGIRFEEIEF